MAFQTSTSKRLFVFSPVFKIVLLSWKTERAKRSKTEAMWFTRRITEKTSDNTVTNVAMVSARKKPWTLKQIVKHIFRSSKHLQRKIFLSHQTVFTGYACAYITPLNKGLDFFLSLSTMRQNRLNNTFGECVPPPPQQICHFLGP